MSDRHFQFHLNADNVMKIFRFGLVIVMLYGVIHIEAYELDTANGYDYLDLPVLIFTGLLAIRLAMLLGRHFSHGAAVVVSALATVTPLLKLAGAFRLFYKVMRSRSIAAFPKFLLTISGLNQRAPDSRNWAIAVAVSSVLLLAADIIMWMTRRKSKTPRKRKSS